jgi:hypothetical protein
MATVKLSQTYLYAGKHYGPGEVEIADAEAAKALTAREAALRPPGPRAASRRCPRRGVAAARGPSRVV